MTALDYPITIQFPQLNPGEKFAGLIVSADGKYRHALILLPGKAEPNHWQAQMDWAKGLGGDLPDRVESALLFATLRDEFKPEWYWTNEQPAADGTYAWHQYFGDGDQRRGTYAWHQYFGDGDQRRGHKSLNYRARTVRRVKI